MNYKKITSLDEVKVGDIIHFLGYETPVVLAKCEGAVLLDFGFGERSWRTLKDLISCECQLEIKEERFKPVLGEDYYYVDLRGSDYYGCLVWNDDVYDNRLFNRGLIFKTSAEATEAAEAMIEFNKNVIKKQ